MSSIKRFFEIFFVIAKYRLDTFLDHSALPLKVRFAFLIFKLFPRNQKSRGERLRFALEELGPIFVKFGQLLSTRPDLIPHDIILELNELQDNVSPFDSQVFKEIVERALKGKVEELFLEYSKEPLASASIAQVHTGKLPSGQEVIIKAVRPGIEKLIHKDTQLLHSIATFVEMISAEGRRFRLVDVVDDYKTTIFDELDLAKEAANASQLRRNFEGSKNLYIPQVYWDYCNRDIIVMERIYGVQVTDREKLEAQGTNFKLLAERGVEVFFTQVFEHNFFHADMHPGNVFVSKTTPDDPSYMAVDMAIVGSLTKEDQYYLARNMLAMFRRDYRQVAELHVVSGWVPEDTSIAGFESAIRSVCEPIFEKPLKDISFGEALITLFQTARRFNMPVQPQLVLLQKTLLNIEGLGRQLYPELDLWETAHPFLERWIRNRYHPKTLFKQFKYYSPDWLEKFPHFPHLVFDSLTEIKNLSDVTPQLREASEVFVQAKQDKNKRIRRNSVAVLAFSGAGYFAWPMLSTAPIEAIALASIGFVSLTLR